MNSITEFRYVQRGLGYNHKKQEVKSSLRTVKFPFKMDKKTFKFVVGSRMEQILKDRNETADLKAIEDYYTDDYDFEFAKSGASIPNFSAKYTESLAKQLKTVTTEAPGR